MNIRNKGFARYIFLILFTILCCLSSVNAATWYVASDVGTDTPTSGTISQPFQSLSYLFGSLGSGGGTQYVHSGDTVYLKGKQGGGVNNYLLPTPTYGCFCPGPTNLFTAWTYFIGDSSDTVTITNQLKIGANGGQYNGYSAYINWTGVTFADGIQSYGSNYFSANYCKIIRADPVLGPDPSTGGIADDKAAIVCEGGNYWSIDHCEITHTGNGADWKASNSSLTNSVIHDVTQDGIEIVGATNFLFQGNDVYGCDDGLDDGEIDPSTGAGYTYHRHDDCLQFEMQNDYAASANSFVTVRGNRFRYAQGQDIQFNNHTPTGTYHNHDILIENNLFGATTGATPVINDGNITDNLTIRNNTILLKQVDAVWNSSTLPGLIAQYGLNYTPRTRVMSHYQIRISPEVNPQVYNNLLALGSVSGAIFTRADHNITQFRTTAEIGGDIVPLGYGCVRTMVPQFANDANDDGVLASNSIAINAGTRLTVNGDAVDTGIYPTDYYGTSRDNRPDIGAYELPGQTPAGETLTTLINNTNPSQWVDNFADGNLASDPLLTTSTTVGLAWSSNADYLQNYNDSNNNLLVEPFTTSPIFTTMTNVPTLTHFSMSFQAFSSTGPQGGGPFFLCTDPQNFFWLDLGTSTTSLHQVIGGVDSNVLPLPGFQFVRADVHNFVVTVTPASVGTAASISVARDGGTPISLNLGTGFVMPTSSTMGLYRNSATQYQRFSYNNFLVQNLSPGAVSIVLDATNGQDIPGGGTSNAPLKTLAYAWPYIQSGDTVYLKGGTKTNPNIYTLPTPPIGYFGAGPVSLFTNWTNFIGDSRDTVQISNALQIGTNGYQNQSYNAYMNWQNVTFTDGISSYGANYFALTNCRVLRQGQLLGTTSTTGVSYSDKVAIQALGGSYWTFIGNEITKSGIGLIAPSNSTFQNNIFHDLTQGGVSFLGITNDLFQGNTIYNCAEGDYAKYPLTYLGYIINTNPVGTSIHRNCFGIQLGMQTDSVNAENTYLIIRGNKIYGIEGNDVQAFNNNSSSTYHNNNVLFENNILGPTYGNNFVINIDTLDNFIFRYNTICMAITSAGLPYSNQFERIAGTNGLLSLGTGSNVQLYNNLLGNGSVSGYYRNDHNIFQFPSGVSYDTNTLGTNSFRTVSQLLKPTNLDGKLSTGSIAIGAGTIIDPNTGSAVAGITTYDIYGTNRRNPPSIGAYEVP